MKVTRKVKRCERKLASYEKLLQGLDAIGFEQLELETKALKEKKENRLKELKRVIDESNILRQETLPLLEQRLQNSKGNTVKLENDVHNNNEIISSLENKYAPLKKKISQERDCLLSKKATQEKEVVLNHYDEALAEESILRRRLDELKAAHFQLSAKLNVH